MKKFFIRLILFILLIIFFASPVLAASEYKNAGFRFSVPDGLIQDTDFANENGYIDYWHTEDYLFEVTIWQDSLTLLHYPDTPTDGYICHGLKKTDDFSYTLVDGAAEEIKINGNVFIFHRSEIIYGDENIQIHYYFLDDGGYDYKRITFITRSDEHLHYIEEIIKTLKISPFHHYAKRNNIIKISIMTVAVIAIAGLVIKNKKKASKKEI